MGAFSAAPLPNRTMRPASEIYYNPLQQMHNQGIQEDSADKAAQQWIADIDQYETTLEEMAAATLDQDFKDELSAIEQWFCVLSEAERTAALYALLRQTTQIQIRFFIGVLQQMSKSHPVSSVLSPANFGEKGTCYKALGETLANFKIDPMATRLSSAMSKLNSDGGSRNSFGSSRPPVTLGGNKRHSGLDPDEINSMFPDAAAAIAKQKAEFTQHTGAAPPATSNRNSILLGDRSSLAPPSITGPHDDSQKMDAFSQPNPSPWGHRSSDSTHSSTRPKSSSGHQPMGEFSQPLPSAGFRSPRAMPLSNDMNLQNTALNALEHSGMGMPLLSPYVPGQSWASMVNTPMVANFSNQQSANQAEMVANATAMKLAALSTVNNRIQLDDARKYRRARSSDDQQHSSMQPPGLQGTTLPANFIMTNENGQILSPHQVAALQAQQLAAIHGQRSRPSSPGVGFSGNMQGSGGMNIPSQGNGYLSAFDSSMSSMNNSMSGLHLGHHYGNSLGGGEGYMSDASEINRGRSPRGKRGNSRPPEDPTDIELLKDIPAWLRSLRLHKYTDNLKDLKWTDLIMLDDDGLEKRGVNALGARRKMTKASDAQLLTPKNDY